ncbi:hypothetical protein EV182_007723, partial [Spiromyces aspiralis]
GTSTYSSLHRAGSCRRPPGAASRTTRACRLCSPAAASTSIASERTSITCLWRPSSSSTSPSVTPTLSTTSPISRSSRSSALSTTRAIRPSRTLTATSPTIFSTSGRKSRRGYSTSLVSIALSMEAVLSVPRRPWTSLSETPSLPPLPPSLGLRSQGRASTTHRVRDSSPNPACSATPRSLRTSTNAACAKSPSISSLHFERWSRKASMSCAPSRSRRTGICSRC